MHSSSSCAEAGVRRRVALLAAVACLAGTASAAAATAVEPVVVAAWDGWSRPGRVTEVEVRLRSEERESAGIKVTAGGDTVRARVDLEPGQWSSLSIPVRAAEAITVRSAVAGRENETRDVRLALSEAPLLAWVAPDAMAGPIAGFHAVTFDPARLPRTAPAYSSIDALVIDRRMLHALAQQQLAALLSYVAGCGRTILIGASPAELGLFRTAVGCNGRSFSAVASPAEVGAALELLLATIVQEPPAPVSLSAVPGPDLRAWYLVVTLLAVSAAATVVAGIFSSSVIVAVVVPALLAVGMLGFVQTRALDSRLTIWAESGAGERLAHYRGLQQATALGRGRVEVPVLAALARPQSCQPGDQVAWSWDAKARRFATAQFEGRLFYRASLCYAGEFPVARSAVARPAADGGIALANTGASTSPAGVLAWNGKLHSVAALRPGEEAELAPEAGSPARGGAQGMALTRTPLDSQAILWPLDLKLVPDAPPQSQAWLLLRVGTAGQG